MANAADECRTACVFPGIGVKLSGPEARFFERNRSVLDPFFREASAYADIDLVGEFLNSFVLAKMKITTQGRYLWMRTIGSTVVGQLADSGIFIFLAFYGTIPSSALVKMAVSQWLVKSSYETLVTPLTYLAVNFLKRAERKDFYDLNTNFNPLRWKD